MNVHGSWANHALALGLPKDTRVKAQVEEFIRRWAQFPVKPEWRQDPPWAQNTQIGDDVNIFEVLPLIRLNDGDGGFYLDKAAVVSKDPEDPENSGKQNVGIKAVEPIGQYAVKLVFDDGHDTGLFTWKYLYELGREQPERWARYLERRAQATRPAR